MDACHTTRPHEPILFALAGLIALRSNVCPGQTPSSAPTAPLIGLRIDDALVIDCVSLVERGEAPRAISRLSDAIRRGDGQSREILNERRLGLGLVQLRGGDVRAARQVLLPLSKLRTSATLARQAQVLLAIAARQPEHKRGSTAGRDAPAGLSSAEAWRDALCDAAAAARVEMEAAHDRIARAIETQRWSDVSGELEAIHEVRARLDEIDLPQARQLGGELLVAHAQRLAGHVRDVNVAIAQLIHLASDLAGLMSLRSDPNSRRRGYLPVDVVERHNALIDSITQANAAGEKLVTEYGRAVAQSAGRIKRDAAVKMSKTRLPDKRPAFGR